MLLLEDVALTANWDDVSVFLVFGFFLPNRHFRLGKAQEYIEYEDRTQTTPESLAGKIKYHMHVQTV